MPDVASPPASRVKTIGMIGLGLMGTAMTERFLEHGYAVRIWNRSKDKADPLLPLGAVWSDNPLAECDRVIISLYTTPVVEEVLEQLKAGLHPRSDPDRYHHGRAGTVDGPRGSTGPAGRQIPRCPDFRFE